MIKPVNPNESDHKLNAQSPVTPAANPLTEPKTKKSVFDNTVDQIQGKIPTANANTVPGNARGSQNAGDGKPKGITPTPSPQTPGQGNPSSAGTKLNTIV